MSKIDELLDNREYDNKTYPLDPVELSIAEQHESLHFPPPLIAFWKKHGYAFFKQGFKDSKSQRGRGTVNRLLTPNDIVLCTTGSDETNFMAPSGGFRKGVIPFFQLGFESYFTVSLEAPYPVFRGSNQYAPSLEAFFDRLADSAKVI